MIECKSIPRCSLKLKWKHPSGMNQTKSIKNSYINLGLEDSTSRFCDDDMPVMASHGRNSSSNRITGMDPKISDADSYNYITWGLPHRATDSLYYKQNS